MLDRGPTFVWKRGVIPRRWRPHEPSPPVWVRTWADLRAAAQRRRTARPLGRSRRLPRRV